MKNPVIDCIYARRSARDFEDRPIPHEITNEILNAAVMAPSAMNTRPWNFSVVEGRKNIDHFAERALSQYNLLGYALKWGFRLSRKESIFYNAQLLIIISGKKDYRWLREDTNLAVENMFLAAHSLGIGACWIGFALPLDKDNEARAELGIPPEYEIAAPLIFGFPKKQAHNIPKRTPRILKWIEP